MHIESTKKNKNKLHGFSFLEPNRSGERQRMKAKSKGENREKKAQRTFHHVYVGGSRCVCMVSVK